MTMNLSPIGEAVLIAREGRRLTAYLDTATPPRWTIGIGCTTVNGKPVTKGMTITSAQCDALFDTTVAKYIATVNSGLKVIVSQNMFDACVSFTYNVGQAGFSSSTLLKRINAGDIAGARDAMLWWDKPASILTRRQAEAEQLVTPYTQALPRPTTTGKPISVAAPVIAVLHPEVVTPAIVPVLPPMSVVSTPNWLAVFGRWVDDVWGIKSA